MPVIYLKHPRHGTKVACGEAEAKYDEGNGWTRFEPAAAQEGVQVSVVPTSPEITITGNTFEAPKRKYTRRAA